MKNRTRTLISTTIWLLALGAAVYLWVRDSESGLHLQGMVQPDAHHVAPEETVRLESLFVRPGDSVKAGQAIAQMETADLRERIAIEQARLEEYEAALVAEEKRLVEDITAQRIALETKRASAKVSMSDVEARTEAEKAELRALSTQIKRLSRAEQAGVAALNQSSTLRTRRARLVKSSQLAPSSLKAYRDLTDTLDAAMGDLPQADDHPRLLPFRARTKTQGKVIENLLERLARRTLRAPTSGQILDLMGSTGDLFGPKRAVLTMVASTSQNVVAYVPETSARTIGVKTTVDVQSIDRSDRVRTQGVVTSIGQHIVQIPERFWPRPTSPVFGRPVHIRLEHGHTLLPGELVTVISQSGGAMAAGQPPAGPQTVTVPPALSARTRIELSGGIWVQEKGMALVISDDTGYPGRDEDAPWTFWLNTHGELAEEPIQMQGLKSVSDWESVTRGPDGQFYLLSSQSLSAKGKRPKKRQRLVRARLEGHQLIVTGKVNLYRRLGKRHPAATLDALGLGAAFDIEGMTWMNDGFSLTCPSIRRVEHACFI